MVCDNPPEAPGDRGVSSMCEQKDVEPYFPCPSGAPRCTPQGV